MYERSLRIFAWISYIRAFWLGSMISILFLKHVGLDDVGISTFHLIIGVLVFCLELPTGTFADRRGYRRSIIAGTVCLALAIGSFLLAAAFGGWVVFFVTAALFSLSSSFSSGAGSAYVYRLLAHRGESGSYLAYQSAVASRSRVIEAVAILLGAWLYARAEYLPYLLQALCLCVAVVLSFRLEPEPRDVDAPAASSRLTAAALREFGSDRLYPLALACLVVAALPWQYFHHVVNQSVFLESGLDVMGIGAAGAAVYLASGFLLRYLPAAQARLGDRGALLAALAAVAACGAGFLSARSAAEILGWSVLLYAAGGALLALLDSAVQHAVAGEEHRATLASLLSMFSSPLVKGLFVAVGMASAGLPYAAAMGWLCLACSVAALPLALALRASSPAAIIAPTISR